MRGVREGVLIFSFVHEAHEFSEIERMFAVRAASRLGQALENARLYERLSDVAVTLQASLARAVPEVEGLSVDLYRRVAYSPQLVGGDFADVFRSGDYVDIVIGDVEGKGVGALGSGRDGAQRHPRRRQSQGVTGVRARAPQPRAH